MLPRRNFPVASRTDSRKARFSLRAVKEACVGKGAGTVARFWRRTACTAGQAQFGTPARKGKCRQTPVSSAPPMSPPRCNKAAFRQLPAFSQSFAAIAHGRDDWTAAPQASACGRNCTDDASCCVRSRQRRTQVAGRIATTARENIAYLIHGSRRPQTAADAGADPASSLQISGPVPSAPFRPKARSRVCFMCDLPQFVRYRDRRRAVAARFNRIDVSTTPSCRPIVAARSVQYSNESR